MKLKAPCSPFTVTTFMKPNPHESHPDNLDVIQNSHFLSPIYNLGKLCLTIFVTAIFPDRTWRQHNKHGDWVWRQQRGKQALVMIDGYRFLEENRLTEHASVWQRSSQNSSEENSFTLDQSCLLRFFHVALNILLHCLATKHMENAQLCTNECSSCSCCSCLKNSYYT